jgi:hypothetical protein
MPAISPQPAIREFITGNLSGGYGTLFDDGGSILEADALCSIASMEIGSFVERMFVSQIYNTKMGPDNSSIRRKSALAHLVVSSYRSGTQALRSSGVCSTANSPG